MSRTNEPTNEHNGKQTVDGIDSPWISTKMVCPSRLDKLGVFVSFNSIGLLLLSRTVSSLNFKLSRAAPLKYALPPLKIFNRKLSKVEAVVKSFHPSETRVSNFGPAPFLRNRWTGACGNCCCAIGNSNKPANVKKRINIFVPHKSNAKERHFDARRVPFGTFILRKHKISKWQEIGKREFEIMKQTESLATLEKELV